MMTATKEPIPSLEMKNNFQGTKEEMDAFNQAIQDPYFVHALTFRCQIGILCKYLRTETIKVSYQRIGDPFNETAHCVMMQHKKFNKVPKLDERPEELKGDQLEDVKNYIQASVSENGHQYFPTYSDVSDFISTQFKKDLLSDTIRHIIRNNFFRIFPVVDGKPMDINRIDVPLSEIEDNLYELNQKIAGIPSSCLTLTKWGARNSLMLVKLRLSSHSIFMEIQRLILFVEKKETQYLFAYQQMVLIVLLNLLSDDLQLKMNFMNIFQKDKIQVVNTKKGFITTKSFLLWLNEVFLPFLHNEREITGYQGQSVLILDGYLPHIKAFESINLQSEKLTLY